MKPDILTSSLLLSFRGVHAFAQRYRGKNCRGGMRNDLPASVVVSVHSLQSSLQRHADRNKMQTKPKAETSPETTMGSLFDGYHPTFKQHRLGREVESLLMLGRSQQMCYYSGKIFGGYLVFLMDRILADCCEETAFTARLDTSFKRPVPPSAPILLRAWPEKLEGRKLYLKGSIQILGEAGGWVDAITAEALFVKPKEKLRI